jgi:hypothetical protein
VYVDEKELTCCGPTLCDAIHLKCGASKWWKSPEAKCAKVSATSMMLAENYSTCFEKRFHAGGSTSLFGSYIVPNKHQPGQDWDWWYYNEVMKMTDPVPEGYVPVLDPEFQDESETM